MVRDATYRLNIYQKHKSNLYLEHDKATKLALKKGNLIISKSYCTILYHGPKAMPKV